MESDPVVKEHKVFLSTQLSQYLHLVLAPSRSGLPACNGSALPGRFKKTSRMVELEVPVDTRHQTYSRQRGEELALGAQSGSIKVVGMHAHGSGSDMLNNITLSGYPVAHVSAKYFAAVFREDGLHLTPVNSVLQIRPALNYLDEMDAKNKASNKKLADMDKPQQAESTKAIQVQFRKKETEEQLAARLNSYAYLKRQVDEEPWIGLAHFSRDTEEASKVAARLFCEAEEPLTFKEQSQEDFLKHFTAVPTVL